MESNIKASFIPDKMPNTRQGGGKSAYSSGGGAGDIFVLIAIVILAASLALAAGVFLYDRFLTAGIQKKGELLDRAKANFEKDTIKVLLRLDSRLQAADEVLARHLAPSELFSLLEELTLKSVSYNSLDYSVGNDGSIGIKLRGKARSVNGVALQAGILGQHNAIINPIFSNLDLVNDGVTFEVTATINPSALLYATTFSQYSAGVEDPANFDDPNQNTDIFDDGTGNSGADFGDFDGGFTGTEEIKQ